MKLKRMAARDTDEMASDFDQLVEQGRALLQDIMDRRPARNVAGLRSTLDDVTERLAGIQSSATRAARQGVKESARYARQADQCLHDNPWPAIAGGIALGGLLATFWWAQRR